MKKNLRNLSFGIIAALLLVMSATVSAQSPAITSTPIVTAAVGQVYTYDVNATGAPTITYSLVTKPADMTINGTTGIITWTPSSTDQNGLVKVMASNPANPPAAIQTFIINITELSPLPASTSGLWQLNEKTGSVYADYLGVSNATATIAPVPSSGIINGAQTFNATSKVIMPDPVDGATWDWAANSSFSFEVWVKTTSTVPSSDIDVFLGRFRHDAYDMTWLIGMNASEKPIFYLRDVYYSQGDGLTHDATIIGTTSINDGEWHHIVAVRDESVNRNKLYVDGVMEVDAFINYPNSFKCSDYGAVPVTLGWYDSGDEHHFSGDLDEVAIFDRALTDVEIAQFYNNGSPAGHRNAINYAPVIESEPVVTATQGTAYNYSFVTNDYDAGDALVLSAIKKPKWLTFNWTAGNRSATLTGTPQNKNVGDTTVTLRVSDGSLFKEQTFALTVANINDAPQITSTPDLAVDEDVVYTYVITATDIDEGDVLTYSAQLLPAWLTFTPATRTLTGTPDKENVGDNVVTLAVSDGTVTIPQTFTIVVASVNVVPVITGQTDLSVNKETPLVLTLANFTVTDADNVYPGDFTLILLDGDHYSVAGTTVTPDAGFTGTINVGVQVSDGEDNSAIYYALIEVKAPSAINNAEQDKLLIVYPNPGTEYVLFEFEQFAKSATLEIYNTSGRVVKKIIVDKPVTRVEAAELGAGTYLYKVTSGDALQRGSFTIINK